MRFQWFSLIPVEEAGSSIPEGAILWKGIPLIWNGYYMVWTHG